jgi:ABC-type transport system substrate-binding protein
MESRFLLVNARQGPFRDPRLRRAVSLALDRRTLAALWASQPAQHVIQPPLQGSAATDSAPAPDVAAARRLVAGRRVHATLVTCRIPAPTCEQTAELVQTQLGQIGIDVTVQLEDDPQPGAHADPLLATWLPDWADPEAALWPLLPHLGAPGTFGTPGISPRLEELARLAAARRVAGLERLARSLERDGEIDVYARTSYVELTSARLGCVVHNPLFPLADLAALCVGR